MVVRIHNKQQVNVGFVKDTKMLTISNDCGILNVVNHTLPVKRCCKGCR